MSDWTISATVCWCLQVLGLQPHPHHGIHHRTSHHWVHKFYIRGPLCTKKGISFNVSNYFLLISFKFYWHIWNILCITKIMSVILVHMLYRFFMSASWIISNAHFFLITGQSTIILESVLDQMFESWLESKHVDKIGKDFSISNCFKLRKTDPPPIL